MVSGLLPLVAVTFTRIQVRETLLEPVFLAKLTGYGLAWAFGCVVLYVLSKRLQQSVDDLAQRQAQALDTLSIRYVDAAIFGAAALSLFLELAVIRWQGTVFPLFAFYKNLGLLACFAGLGLGYALARRRPIPLVLTLPLLAWQIALLTLLRYSGEGLHARSLMVAPITEQVNMMLATASRPHSYIPIYLFLACVFALTALAFVPVGQVCGRLMARRANLRAYGLNLLGSLAGVVLMHGISFLWAPPAVWFGLGFAGLLVFQGFARRGLALGGLGAAGGLIVLLMPVAPAIERIYSPYQVVERRDTERGMAVCVSGMHYQVTLDLAFDNPDRASVPFLRTVAKYYELPYEVYASSGDAPDRVAIVGTGTGNDVAGALRVGARHVDAIEIDPAIMQLGVAYHPEKPYSDPRVRAIVNDARSFFRQTEQTYDLVVYGFLDSLSALSHASNVRVDSFVYTVEGIREARARLKPGGLMSITYNTVAPEMGRKLFLMMQEAFDGRPPVCVRAKQSDYGAVMFLQGDDFDIAAVQDLLGQAGFEECTATYADPQLRADLPTDDWPFFYMPRRVYPVSYLGMIALVLLLSAVLIRGLLGERPQPGHIPFFFLGAGFMLVETKGITELGLAFGNTWQVIGIVIAGVLVMAFLANCAVALLRIRRPVAPFVLLLIALAAGWLVARSGGFPPTAWGRWATVAVLTCPVLFSGIVFSTLLRSDKDISGVMAANLLGAMCGGLLEYNSMYFGFRFLYILAIALYILAFASHLRPALTQRRGIDAGEVA